MKTLSSSKVGTHMGNVLMMLANKYTTLPLTIVEMVQNAIDANASRVFIGVDLDRHEMIVLDNGTGVDKMMFEEALASVAETKKSKTQIGRFGIGMISPLNKCKQFFFTSQSIISSHPVRWTFEKRQIERQKEDVNIPCENLPSMPAIPRDFVSSAGEISDGHWRTHIHLIGLTEDRTVSRIDLDLVEDQVRTKLGYYLQRKGIEARIALIQNRRQTYIDIKPHAFMGEPLGVVSYVAEGVGDVEIELYRARKVNGKRSGKVAVSEMDTIYPISWNDIVNQARSGGWADKSAVFDVLGSGYFEGVIKAKGISLAPERTKFEFNDALISLYCVLDQWYSEVGRTQFEAEKDQQRDERYHQIGLAVMSSIREMLRLPEFESLTTAVQSHLKIGVTGSGHGDSGKPQVGTSLKPTTRVGQGGAGRARTPGAGGSSGRTPDGATRDGDMPFGVVGRGKRRAEVKDDSLGLWIEVIDFEYSTRLWEFDRTRGLLSFNSSNAIWADLDGEYAKRRTTKNDKMLEHLQKWVILKVLVLLTLSEEDFESAREIVDRETKAYVFAFIKS